MYVFLQELDLFVRIKFIIFIPSLLCLAVIAAAEYLKYSQEGTSYKAPKILSVLCLLIYLTTDSVISIVIYLLGFRGLVTDIAGIVAGIIITLLVWFVVSRRSGRRWADENMFYKELEGCTGVITKSVRKSGSGVVAVRYNDKTVEATVIAEESISRGERVKIIGSTKDWLVCEKEN